MNYFEFYELPVSFIIDENTIKKKYLVLSKKYHPDFYINQPEEKQKEILELSTFNTKAYQTLSNWDKRIKYVLELYTISVDNETKMPQQFLVEMMDINEAIMEFEFDKDSNTKEKIISQIHDFELDLENSVNDYLQNFELLEEPKKAEALIAIKNYYLKRKYLLRIKDRLNTFATH